MIQLSNWFEKKIKNHYDVMIEKEMEYAGEAGNKVLFK